MTPPRDTWLRWWRAQGERELRALLMAHWDPIGVRGKAGARDEYDAYVSVLGNRLRAGADAQAVAEYLAGVERDQMGFETDAGQLREVATQVVDWYRRAGMA